MWEYVVLITPPPQNRAPNMSHEKLRYGEGRGTRRDKREVDDEADACVDTKASTKSRAPLIEICVPLFQMVQTTFCHHLFLTSLGFHVRWCLISDGVHLVLAFCFSLGHAISLLDACTHVGMHESFTWFIPWKRCGACTTPE